MFPGERSLVVQRPVKQAIVRTARWVKSHPLVAKSVPTAIGFCFGDVLTQYGQRHGKRSWLDLKKTAGMLVIGAAIAGPLGLGILQLPGSSPTSVGLKILADQVVGCIIWQAAYLQISPEYRTAALSLLKTVQESADGQQAVLKSKFRACMPSS